MFFAASFAFFLSHYPFIYKYGDATMRLYTDCVFF